MQSSGVEWSAEQWSGVDVNVKADVGYAFSSAALDERP